MDWVIFWWALAAAAFTVILSSHVFHVNPDWHHPLIYYLDYTILFAVLFYIVYRLLLCRTTIWINILVSTLAVVIIMSFRLSLLNYPVTFALSSLLIQWVAALIAFYLFAWIWGWCRLATDVGQRIRRQQKFNDKKFD